MFSKYCVSVYWKGKATKMTKFCYAHDLRLDLREQHDGKQMHHAFALSMAWATLRALGKKRAIVESSSSSVTGLPR